MKEKMAKVERKKRGGKTGISLLKQSEIARKKGEGGPKRRFPWGEKKKEVRSKEKRKTPRLSEGRGMEKKGEERCSDSGRKKREMRR